MSRKTLLVLVLLAAASVASSGPRGTVPKAAANRYPSHAEQDSVSVGAALLTSDEVRKTFVSEVNRCCVVVEVALYPPKDKPQSVSLDDFSVRVMGSETAVKPSSAKVVAASIQKSAESQRDVTVSPSVGVGYESGPYGGHGSYKAVGVAVAWAPHPGLAPTAMALTPRLVWPLESASPVHTRARRNAIATRCKPS